MPMPKPELELMTKGTNPLWAMLEEETRKAFKSFSIHTKALFAEYWMDNHSGEGYHRIGHREKKIFSDLLGRWNGLKAALAPREVEEQFGNFRHFLQRKFLRGAHSVEIPIERKQLYQKLSDIIDQNNAYSCSTPKSRKLINQLLEKNSRMHYFSRHLVRNIDFEVQGEEAAPQQAVRQTLRSA